MKILLLLVSIFSFAGCAVTPEPAETPETVETPEALPDFNTMWEFNDPAKTEQTFRELLPQAEASGDLSYHAQLLTQIARTEGLQRKFEDAHKTLDIVESMLTEALPVIKIRYLLERGRTVNSSGDPEKSRPLFTEAWELAVTDGEDFYAVDAAHMMGIVETPEKQVEWSLKAMEHAEKSDDAKAKLWLGALYNNLGWTYHDTGDYETALELFNKGLLWRQEKNDLTGTFIAKWTVARTYRSLKWIDKALEMQLALEKEMKENEKLPDDGYVYEELGECYLIKGDGAKAQTYFGLAYTLLSQDQWLAANEADRLNRLKTLMMIEE